MRLNTKYHGVREYEEKDVLTFKKGIPSFENLTKFIIFPIEENEVFSVLHSIEDNAVGFIIMSPFDVMQDYEFKLDDELIKRLKIESSKDVLAISIVTLNSKVENITTNLCAPIIINIKEKLGEQIILNNEKYLIKHPLFKEDVQC
ncbi:flagellar assembly protein FliW [Clostridium sp. MB40-C1]|uniref:flagellar assembly protein FliW n=1 Tax=Clostridium sp. MB40-C1 TaxID=3070996 RepID=UPI0027E01AEF|nr:flagellar assembly protein FliW [Clostridium sp. MB40-C1]WMJ81303.1 flagellar assembly protein FliW [Clostridium sp. MB40-C1]